MNETFSEAIVVTDVGQHQMWTTQYLEMNEYKQLLTSGALAPWAMDSLPLLVHNLAIPIIQ